jgi:hypothetical protein
LLFLYACFCGKAQLNQTLSSKAKSNAASIQNLVSTLDHDTCLDKKFSIVFYIVQDSTYSVGSATQATLNAVVNALNTTFKPICVSFENCSTVLIPNYPFNKWKKNITEPVVTSNWYTAKTINFYIVDSIKPISPIITEVYGYAYGPLPNTPPSANTHTDVIVMEREKLLMPNLYALFHHMGHFFGLPHTYDEIGTNTSTVTPSPNSGVTSYEFVDGSNCYEHGDGFCDTEADGVGAIADGKSQRYIPPIDNYMSNSENTGCKYSQEQYNYMARIILKKRLYLH